MIGRATRGALRVAITVVLAAAGPGSAQTGPEPEGTWDALWASAVRDDGDAVRVQRESPAVLVLEQEGGTLTGSWSIDLVGPETWLITGSFLAGVLRMEATTTADGAPPSEDGARMVRIEWTARLSADGQTLTGELWLTLETPRGLLRSAPRPWTARRRTAYPDSSRPPPSPPAHRCPPGPRPSPS